MKDEDVDIVKMDATANDVPPQYNVQGFPTIFWKPKGGVPRNYNVSKGHFVSSFSAEYWNFKFIECNESTMSWSDTCSVRSLSLMV